MRVYQPCTLTLKFLTGKSESDRHGALTLTKTGKTAVRSDYGPNLEQTKRTPHVAGEHLNDELLSNLFENTYLEVEGDK